MIRRLRYLSFFLVVASAFVAIPVLAEDAAMDEGSAYCASPMAIQYRSNTSQGAAQNYCETISCTDACAAISCGGGGSSSATGCATCNHAKGSWSYAAHGDCDCQPM